MTTMSEHDIRIRTNPHRGETGWACETHGTKGEIGLSMCNPTKTGHVIRVLNDGTPTAELMADLVSLDERIERIGTWVQTQFEADRMSERQFHQLIEALGLVKNSARWVRKGVERAPHENATIHKGAPVQVQVQEHAWEQGWQARNNHETRTANPYFAKANT